MAPRTSYGQGPILLFYARRISSSYGCFPDGLMVPRIKPPGLAWPGLAWLGNKRWIGWYPILRVLPPHGGWPIIREVEPVYYSELDTISDVNGVVGSRLISY